VTEESTVNAAPESLQEAYIEHGYAITKQVFKSGDLALLRESLRSVLNKSAKNGASEADCSLDELILKREAEDHSLVYNAAQSVGSSAATYQVLGSSEIFDIVFAITGFEKASLHLMPMYLIIQLPSDERFDYTWHQDGTYYPWCKDFLTLWFPVNRSVNQETGTISLIPGSHRDGPRESETFLRHGYFKQMQSKLREGELDRQEVLDINLGDCCIMSGNEVHCSIANRTTSPRIAGVLRIAYLGSLSSYDREQFYCVHKS
jgi:ectoine hydroxylase-related dioxygenase (phytanoyl-CoA dioxygenase family)